MICTGVWNPHKINDQTNQSLGPAYKVHLKRVIIFSTAVNNFDARKSSLWIRWSLLPSLASHLQCIEVFEKLEFYFTLQSTDPCQMIYLFLPMIKNGHTGLVHKTGTSLKAKMFHKLEHFSEANIFKHFWRTSILFVWPLIILFWISGDVWSGFQNKGKFPHMIHQMCTTVSSDSPLSVTPADFLAPSMTFDPFSHLHSAKNCILFRL